MAGGDKTDFERAVEKVVYFRENYHAWTSSIEFFVQEGIRIAARLVCEMGMGGEKAKKMELMFMVEVDGEGLFEAIWEQAADWTRE